MVWPLRLNFNCPYLISLCKSNALTYVAIISLHLHKLWRIFQDEPVTSMPVKEKAKAEKLRKQTENPDATGGDEKREHAYSFDIMNPPSF